MVRPGRVVRVPDAGRALHDLRSATTEPIPRDAWGTDRRSRLFPGPLLAHADLHNHTTLSDGAGDPADAFASLRDAGLDVAAITDHSRWGTAFLGLMNAPGWTGIDGRDWRLTAALADKANADGEFVALRGFEWSDFYQGHMNVWGSRGFTDPLHTFPTMGRFWRWLEKAVPGADFDEVLAGFNHAGTGRGRFARFGYRPEMAERLVTFEIFNKTDEYLFKCVDRGRASPLSECLDAGWRVGLIGVTDEHGADWGRPDGKGRAGLYLTDLTRRGVAEALSARRVFASRVKGLRLDAALSVPGSDHRARMGTTLTHDRGSLLVEVDLDPGVLGPGRPLGVQVLRPGRPVPALAAAVELPSDGAVLAFEVHLDRTDGDWVVLRVSDPLEPPDPRAPVEYSEHGRGIAYASPWWLASAPARARG